MRKARKNKIRDRKEKNTALSRIASEPLLGQKTAVIAPKVLRVWLSQLVLGDVAMPLWNLKRCPG
jgi:hypothetical protein